MDRPYYVNYDLFHNLLSFIRKNKEKAAFNGFF